MNRFSLRAILCLCFLLFAIGCGGDKSTDTDTSTNTKDTPTSGCTSNEECAHKGDGKCRIGVCVASICASKEAPNGQACEDDPCFTNQTCQNGACQGETDAGPPLCDGTTCTPDACGNPCECSEGLLCKDDECVEDTCNGYIYEGCCMPGGLLLKHCTNQGLINTYDCGANNKVCGWNEEVGHYYCMDTAIPPPDPESFPYVCPGEVCEPDCENKTCGGDGCGGSCGTCNDEKFCHDFNCVPDPCTYTDLTGCCEGPIIYACVNEEPMGVTCPENCGWNPTANGGSGWYDCGFMGASPDPENPINCNVEYTCTTEQDCGGLTPPLCNKAICSEGVCKIVPVENGLECATDICAEKQTCQAGKCDSGTPLPDTCFMMNLSCGEDACANPCGTCELGFECKKGKCEVELPTTYTVDAGPILVKYCAPCHTDEHLGGHDIAGNYADAVKAAGPNHAACAGKNIAECSVILIKTIKMPKDAPGSVSKEDVQILQDWLDEGLLL